MARRRRREPIWPWLLIACAIGFGVGLGVRATGGSPFDGFSRSLEVEPVVETQVFIPSQGDRIRVEVLNAGGVRGAAAEGRDRLRDGGFDVVYFGNAPAFGEDPTRVLDRTGKPGAAAAVAGTLGVSEVHVEPDTTLLVDVTVLLGTDWSGDLEEPGSTPEESEGESPERTWWDPRRLMDLLYETR